MPTEVNELTYNIVLLIILIISRTMKDTHLNGLIILFQVNARVEFAHPNPPIVAILF